MHSVKEISHPVNTNAGKIKIWINKTKTTKKKKKTRESFFQPKDQDIKCLYNNNFTPATCHQPPQSKPKKPPKTLFPSPCQQKPGGDPRFASLFCYNEMLLSSSSPFLARWYQRRLSGEWNFTSTKCNESYLLCPKVLLSEGGNRSPHFYNGHSWILKK